MAYVPKHFSVREVFSKHMCELYKGHESRLWSLMDNRTLWTMDQLRILYGTATMNDWSWGGGNSNRGFRDFYDLFDVSNYTLTHDVSVRVGAKRSQHLYGRAADMVFRSIPAANVRADMRINPHRQAYQYIRGIETGISWLHFDIGNRRGNEIRFFKP